VQNAQETVGLLQQELITLKEQGCDTEEEERRVAALLRHKKLHPTQLDACWKRLERLLPRPDFPYSEPDGLEEIQAQRPPEPPELAAPPRKEQLQQKMLGAWTGRAAGCMLGKPVEGWDRDKIRELLEFCDDYPLSDYFPPVPPNDRGIGYGRHTQGLLRGTIDRARRDDDTDYPVLGLRMLETHGKGFTPQQLARAWMEHLPFGCVYTAERVAYRNFVNGIWPPASARHRNPYREWIGAQIRADIWGYVCPGAPQQAAALAYKDACISHTANGIYGEMWVAAMVAAAFACNETEEVVRAGLAQIPQKCRLAEAIQNVLSWAQSDPSPQETIDRVLDAYGAYSGVHTINNAAIVAGALLWGEKDFSKSVSIAVMAGLDTDCNGATVGSIVGALVGYNAIPDRWKAPLNNRLETCVSGEAVAEISALAQRTIAIAQAGNTKDVQ